MSIAIDFTIALHGSAVRQSAHRFGRSLGSFGLRDARFCRQSVTHALGS